MRMEDPDTESPDREPVNHGRVDLDYYSYSRPNAGDAAPDPARGRRVARCTILLLAGWVPYACGLLNALVAARPYLGGDLLRSHQAGALLFLTLGVAVSA